MTSRIRRWLFLLILGPAVAALLGWGVAGLPSFGEFDGAYTRLLNHVARRERQTQNVVAAVAYDYRGMDTLIEESMLFAAVTGITLLLRAMRSEAEEQENSDEEQSPDREVPATSDAVRALGLLFAAFTAVFGMYMILHSSVSPGGGFQGGVIVASALLLIYVAGNYDALKRIIPKESLDPAEALGVIGFAGVGLAGLAAAGSYLTNVLPLGTAGDLLSAGTIPLINVGIGLSVGAGLVLLLMDFIEQTLILRERQKLPPKEKPHG